MSATAELSTPELPTADLVTPMAGSDGAGPNLDAILRIPVSVQVVLGSAAMPVADLMKLGQGAVISLGQRVGEPVDVVVNGRVIARGEVVVVEGEPARFGVSLTEIVGPQTADAPCASSF